MRRPHRLEVIGTFQGPLCAIKHREITSCKVTVRIDPLHISMSYIAHTYMNYEDFAVCDGYVSKAPWGLITV